MTTNALKVWQSILASLMFIAGAANLADVMPDQAAAWFVLLVGAASAGTGYYTAQVGTTPADLRSSRH